MKEFIYYDFDVFDDFDCDTAFLLGMIFTDGSLYEYSNTGKQFIRIINKNKYLIENCRDILKSNLEIHFVKEREYNGIKQGGFYYLHISNEDIIDELIEFGMCEKKNSNIKFPYLPDELYPHFIRGLWAGSGSIALSKNAIASAFSSCSFEFILDLEKQLNKIGLTKRNINTNKHTKTENFYIKYSVNDTKKLYDYIYKNVTPLTIYKLHQEKLFSFFEEKIMKIPKRKMIRKQ